MKTLQRRFALLMVMLMVIIGCDAPPATSKKSADNTGTTIGKSDHDDHDHGEGPHGGTIFDLGKYHAEFCVDHDKKQATVYILSGNLKKAVPIAAEKLLLSIKSPTFQTDVLATPLDGEPKGKSSRFVATHDNLGKVQEFAGTVSVDIDGVPYVGDFEEKPHTMK